MITVTRLIRYPMKGGRGIATNEMALDELGPAGDRRWMVVTETGEFLTQRELPRLCLVTARPLGHGLELAAPGVEPLDVAAPAGASPRVTVRVWKDRMAAIDAGEAAARWLTAWLGASVRLVYMPASTVRPTDPNYDTIGGRVSFADGFPLLLAGEASAEAVSARASGPIPMSRFRPNVVVAGAPAFAEDSWRHFRIGSIGFDAVKPCARCQVTTVDQDSGSVGREPLRALATFRKRGSKVFFGVNVVHRGLGTIRVGDAVIVETTGPGVLEGDQ